MEIKRHVALFAPEAISEAGKDVLPMNVEGMLICFMANGHRGRETSGTVWNAALLGKARMRELRSQLIEEGFTAKPGETFRIRFAGAKAPIAVIGTGVIDASPRERLSAFERWAAACVRIANEGKRKKICLVLPEDAAQEELEAALLGAMLAGYVFERHKSEKKGRALEALFIHEPVIRRESKWGAACERSEALADAITLARDLVNEPASVATPTFIANAAHALADECGLRVEVKDSGDLVRMGMHALLAVSRGSKEEPRLVHLSYVPKNPKTRVARVALVGKGVTFDSGGLSLKSAGGMETMKDDMAGAAAVIAVMQAVARLKPPVEVHAIAGLCENMPSGDAYKPGDIVMTMSGKTIEVLNTDAEGRVTLADTLHYATTLQPDVIVDLATLTGAITVALGGKIAGLFSNDDYLADDILAAAKDEGEPLHRMPLAEEYRESMKSGIADLRNVSADGGAGAIKAALFLEEFVGKIPWAHIDIAGPAFDKKTGATGYGVRTVLRWIEGLK